MLFKRDRQRTGQLDEHGRPVKGQYDDENDPKHSGFHAAHARGHKDNFEIDAEGYGVALDANGEPIGPANAETCVDTSDYGHRRVYRKYTRR